MPISRDEFESQLDQPVFLVLQFLRLNMETAYTATEISIELRDYDEQMSDASVQRALDELVGREGRKRASAAARYTMHTGAG